MEIEWTGDIKLGELISGEKLGVFEVRKRGPVVDKNLDEKRNLRIYTFELTTFETGEFEIPPFKLKYLTADNLEKEAVSLPIKVKVESVLPADTKLLTLRPFKPPAEIPARYTRLYRFIAGVIGIIIFSLVGYWFWRKWRKLKYKSMEQIETLRPPDEIARQELMRIKNSALLSEGKIKEYYSQVADTIRIYLGRRYNILAIDMTSFELLNTLESQIRLDTEILNLLSEFLDECDLVKFAKYIPPQEQWLTLIDRALKIIELTTPKVMPPASSSEAGIKLQV
ncbi:MAG: hypothetical protein N2246_02120 [Candidatus Sumerlaeia bacterium]|nr:hypothetical protein [Candidatus Sumerlaeia bacterium]